jgi:hypothetical protein
MDNKQTKSSWEKFFLLKVKHFTDLPITELPTFFYRLPFTEKNLTSDFTDLPLPIFFQNFRRQA